MCSLNVFLMRTCASKETYLYGTKALLTLVCICTQKQKRPIIMAKEAYHFGKRGLCVYMHAKAKETYHYGKSKRDLLLWQKRPIMMAKETYYYGKRDLL